MSQVAESGVGGGGSGDVCPQNLICVWSKTKTKSTDTSPFSN